jgi:hypothetical protein
MKKQQEGWQTIGKSRASGEGQTSACALKHPPHALTVVMENADLIPVTQGWVGDKPYLVTLGTGEYVTVARPDIAAGWPKRQPNQRVSLQMVSGETRPILKEVFIALNLGWHPLKIWVFVADIANELILGLDVLRAYDASVDIGRQTLCLAEEEVSSCSPGAGPRPSSLVVAMAHVIPAWCQGIVSRK